MIRWSEVTAVFGGAFDPPHLGHRELVRGLFKTPGVKRVIIIPTATPPHKATHTPLHHRLEMTKIGFASHLLNPFPKEVEISLIETERYQATLKPSYTFETLMELKRSISHLAWVIGADQLKDLPRWYRFPEVLSLAHWVVLERKPMGQKILSDTLREWEGSGLIRIPEKTSPSCIWEFPKYNTFLSVFPTEAPALSSSEIRKAIERRGESPSGSILPEVEAYLKQHSLYGMRTP